MALSNIALSGLIRTNLLADSATGAQNNAALTALCDALASAIVVHITTSATVVGTSATGGPVTGTVV